MELLYGILGTIGAITVIVCTAKLLLSFRRNYEVWLPAKKKFVVYTFPTKKSAVAFACAQPEAWVHRRYVGGSKDYIGYYRVETKQGGEWD